MRCRLVDDGGRPTRRSWAAGPAGEVVSWATDTSADLVAVRLGLVLQRLLPRGEQVDQALAAGQRRRDRLGPDRLLAELRVAPALPDHRGGLADVVDEVRGEEVRLRL